MKYIRTNDNIYPFDNPKKWCDILKNEFYKIGDEDVYLEDIIKEANTIEELCDGYICEHVNEKGEKLKPMIMYDAFIWPIYTVAVYGAIWIRDNENNPILKSVAKLNEKGKLELI